MLRATCIEVGEMDMTWLNGVYYQSVSEEQKEKYDRKFAPKRPRRKESLSDRIKSLKSTNEVLRQRISDLENEAKRLRFSSKRTTDHSQGSAISIDMLNRLIRLSHPDKHGGSESANQVTAWLLAQRERAAAKFGRTG